MIPQIMMILTRMMTRNKYDDHTQKRHRRSRIINAFLHEQSITQDVHEDALAFYDALETNDSMVKILEEPILKKIAHELVDAVKKNATIDWTIRENVQAKLISVKWILRKYGYLPDNQEMTTRTVLEQAEVLSEMWAI